jgi:hypothetical protein
MLPETGGRGFDTNRTPLAERLERRFERGVRFSLLALQFR